jgi:hypothetical protein
MDLVSVFGHFARRGKIVRLNWQWTGTNLAVVGTAISGIAIVAFNTLVTVIAGGRVLAIFANSCVTIAGFGMAITLAWDTISAEGTFWVTVVAGSAIFTGEA